MFQSPHTFFFCLDNNSTQPLEKVPYLAFSSKGGNRFRKVKVTGAGKQQSWNSNPLQIFLRRQQVTHHPAWKAQVAAPLWVSIFSHPLRVSVGQTDRLGGQWGRQQEGVGARLGVPVSGDGVCRPHSSLSVTMKMEALSSQICCSSKRSRKF